MQRRVRTTIRPDDVFTVEEGDYASLQGQGLILEVLDDAEDGDDGQGSGDAPATPPESPVEVPVQQSKGRGKETGDGR